MGWRGGFGDRDACLHTEKMGAEERLALTLPDTITPTPSDRSLRLSLAAASLLFHPLIHSREQERVQASSQSDVRVVQSLTVTGRNPTPK